MPNVEIVKPNFKLWAKNIVRTVLRLSPQYSQHIVLHLKSELEDVYYKGYNLGRRIEQEKE